MAVTAAVLSASSSLLCIHAIARLQAKESNWRDTFVWERVPLLLRKWTAQRRGQQVTDSEIGASARTSIQDAAATGWHKAAKQLGGMQRGGKHRRAVPPCRAKWRQALRRHLHKIVLVVNNNFPDIARSTKPFLQRVYGPFFDKIVFIAPEAVPRKGIRARSEHPFGKRWYGAYLALEWIVKEHPDAEGYLWTNDDVALNYWKLRGANKSKIWAQRYLGRNFPFYAGQKTEFEDDWPASPSTRHSAWMAYEAMESSFRAQFERSMMPVLHKYPKRVSDIFYLPRNDSLVLVEKLLPHFKQFSVWSEVAVPMMLFALRHPAQYDGVLDSMVYRWEHRANKSLIFDPRHFWDPDSVGLHPWKLSKLAARVHFLQTLGAVDSCMLTLRKYEI